MIRRREAPDGREDGFVEVWNYPNIAAAEVGKYKLELHGIEAEIFGGRIDSYYLTAIGGISLRVRKSDFGLAKRILESEAETDEGIVDQHDEIHGRREYCPECHSLDLEVGRIGVRQRRNPFMRLWQEWFGSRYLWICRNCGKQWRSRSASPAGD